MALSEEFKKKTWKKGQSGNPKGRPRKTIRVVNEQLEEIGAEPVKEEELKETFLRMFNMTMKEIKDAVDDHDQPSVMRIVGKAMLSGKGFDIIEKMLDRAIGKATNKTDITTKGNEIQFGTDYLFPGMERLKEDE